MPWRSRAIPRSTPRTAVAVIALCLAAMLAPGLPASAASARGTDLTLPVTDGPLHNQHITIHARIYYPQHTPAPAVLISPGFGGTVNSLDAEAEQLLGDGFVVLTYTPRGFGRSGGRIALNDPDYEVSDAHQLVNWLATRPQVQLDAPGDPRIGVTGASYGGALSLLLAGTDKRIDAIAPLITYNNLATALVPNSAGNRIPASTPAAGASGADGVFKKSWAGNLFAIGLAGRRSARPGCGAFTAAVCAAYTQLATSGRPDASTLALLRHDSPASVTGRITAPTLLVQGEQDALFGLDQADANARQIAAAGSTVKVAWYAGGHDGAPPGAAVYAKVSAWFEHYLAGRGPTPPDTFSYALSGPVGRRGAETRTTVAPAYPGLRDSAVTRNPVSLHGSAQLITNPPGGSPAAISALPGIGSGLGALASKLAIDVPGEFATFDGPRLAHPGLITGASTVRLRISAVGTAPAHGAVLFAKLYDVSAQGKRSLPGSSVAPLRVSGLGTGGSKTVSVSLPGIVTSVPAGHHLELVVSTTDAAYANSSSPASYRIALAGDRALRVPVVTGHTANGSIPIGQLIAIGALLALALSAAVVLWWSGLYRRRRPGGDQADIPLEFHGVSKVYGRDRIVVRDLSFTVQRGQVVGLLGPNGAGKTTALRIALGLVQPASGQVRVFGHEVTPGAPVLSRVGAFVEQSGFLPHLSGAQNLRLYWAATGRPESESRMAQALDIADLDTAVDRKVGTYSQGMRQRLAIAQAMLGLPELLILDEPTNGLDPPQIRDMRAVLRRYASEGRTVLVSSHLLAEVEQTCDHVVVMHNGRLVATGAVDEVVAAGGETSFEVDRPSQAAALLDAVDGVSIVSTEGSTVHAELNGTPAAVAVASLVGADIAVRRVGPRRRLEDAFLALIGDSPEGSGQRQDSETSETSEAGSGR